MPICAYVGNEICTHVPLVQVVHVAVFDVGFHCENPIHKHYLHYKPIESFCIDYRWPGVRQISCLPYAILVQRQSEVSLLLHQSPAG